MVFKKGRQIGPTGLFAVGFCHCFHCSVVIVTYGIRFSFFLCLQKYADEIRPCVTDTVTFLYRSIQEGKSILVEGANATMLDIDFG